MSKRKQESLFWGVILLIIGVLFLLANLDIEFNVWHFIGKFWPVILIAVGAKGIYQHFSSKNSDAEIE